MVRLNKSNSCLVTRREYKLTLILLITGLLGSITGLLGVAAFGMRFYEKNKHKLMMIIESKKELSKILKSRRILLNEFINDKEAVSLSDLA